MYFLCGERIGLRALTEEDVEGNYGKWFNDAEVCRYNSHHRFLTTKENLIDYLNEVNKNTSALVLAVEIIDSNIHIGNISMQYIDYINGCAEIAFIFGEKEYWGNGYAEESAKLLINHTFQQLRIQRIYFGTSSENLAMQSLGHKLGFVKEGIRRNALYKNGHYCDIYEYGLLKKEWMEYK